MRERIARAVTALFKVAGYDGTIGQLNRSGEPCHHTGPLLAPPLQRRDLPRLHRGRL